MNKNLLIPVLIYFFILLTLSSLNAQWAITYGGYVDEVANSIHLTRDGGYIVAFYTESFGE